jgi:hypothetical protein
MNLLKNEIDARQSPANARVASQHSASHGYNPAQDDDLLPQWKITVRDDPAPP